MPTPRGRQRSKGGLFLSGTGCCPPSFSRSFSRTRARASGRSIRPSGAISSAGRATSSSMTIARPRFSSCVRSSRRDRRSAAHLPPILARRLPSASLRGPINRPSRPTLTSSMRTSRRVSRICSSRRRSTPTARSELVFGSLPSWTFFLVLRMSGCPRASLWSLGGLGPPHARDCHGVA